MTRLTSWLPFGVTTWPDTRADGIVWPAHSGAATSSIAKTVLAQARASRLKLMALS
jgi:hypothetical protein